MSNAGTPQTPTPGPSILTWLSGTGALSGGKANLPSYSSWQAALQDPTLQKLIDPSWSASQKADAATNYLRDVYGLSGNYKVDESGNIVDAQSWLGRNAWWAIPAGIVGAPLIGAAVGGIGGLGAAGSAGVGASAGLPGLASGTTISSILGAGGGGGIGLGTQLGLGLAGQGLNTIAGIWGVNKQTNAANEAAAEQAAAAKYAADLQKQEADAAIAFQQKQADQQQANWQQTQNANYDQWLAGANFDYGKYKNTYENLAPYRGAGVGATNTIAGLLGIPIAPTAPVAAWNPPANPFAGGGGGSRGAVTPDITNALQGLYKQYGVTPTGAGTGPTDLGYFAQKVADTGGWTGGNVGYWTDRIKQELQKAGIAVKG